MPFKSKQQRRWMYANKPEMAEKWEAHTPKGTNLPERATKNKKKRKRKKKACFAPLVKVATLFAFAAELKDRFDYLRQTISGLKFIADNDPIFGKIEELLAKPRQINWQTAQEDIKDILQELYNLRKYFMRQGNRWAEGILQREYNKLNQFGENSREYYRQFLNMPRREFAQPKSHLYHGTNPADAYSVLVNREFFKSSAFDVLSLTSELTVAAKFGNVIFAFDPKVIQRRKAKKQRYLPEKEYLEMFEKGLQSENYKSPFISEIYRYEQEWVLPLPFKFDESDLDKIIVFVDKGGVDEAKQTALQLDSVAPDTVKTEVRHLPAYSQHSSSTMEHQDVKYGELKSFIYKNIISVENKIRAIVKDIAEKQVKKIKEEYGDATEEQLNYLIKNDSVIRGANSFYNIFQHMRGNSVWWGKHDLNSWVSDLQNATHDIERLNHTAFSDIVPLLEELKRQIYPLKHEFANAYLQTNDDYMNEIMHGGKYGLGAYKDAVVFWLRQRDLDGTPRTEYLKKIIENPVYQEHYGKYGSESVRSILENITSETDSPETAKVILERVPTEVWREYPSVLAANEFLYTLDPDYVKSILSNNSKIDKYFIEKIDHGWLWEQSSDSNKKMLDGMSLFLEQQNAG